METLRNRLKVVVDRLSGWLDSLLVLVQALYLIRFPILTLIVVAGFMPLTLYAATALLENLYDLDSFWKTFWFALSAYLLTFSAVTTLKLALLYGGERVGFDAEARKRVDEQAKKFAGSWVLLLAACLLTAVMISGLVIRTREHLFENVLGSIAGLAAASLLLVAADVLQRLLNRRSKAELLGGFLLPFKNPLIDWANKSEYIYDLCYWILRPKIVDIVIRRLPPFLGRGYIRYTPEAKPEIDEDNRAVVYPEHVTAIVLFILFFAVYLIVGWTPQEFRSTLQVTALTYVMLLLTVLVWALSALAFFLDRYRLPVVVVLIPLFAIASITSEDQLFTVVDPRGPDQVQASQLLTPTMVLSSPPSDPAAEDFAIVVAANGGGIQAAGWTARVLTGLEEMCRAGKVAPSARSCANKIKLISGVSGGSVGAMYFLDAYEPNGIPEAKLKDVVANAEESSLDAAAWGLVYPDLSRSVLPFYWSGYGRGHALEDQWAKTNTGLNNGLLSWREGVRAGWRPASIFNATVVETGERLLLSTSDMCEKKSVGGSCLEVGQIKAAGAETQKVQMDKKSFYSFIEGKDIPIKTAARLSASFPYVTPAPRAQLPPDRKPSLHVADGGYYDNYGISSLIEWLNEGLENRPSNLKYILVIQIRGDVTQKGTTAESASGAYYQTLAPLYTLLNVRTTGQLSHNESELDIFMRYWRLKKDCVDIQTAVFEFPRDAKKDGPPLSWHLRKDQKQEIQNGWEKILAGNDDYKAWEKFVTFIKQRTEPSQSGMMQCGE